MDTAYLILALLVLLLLVDAWAINSVLRSDSSASRKLGWSLLALVAIVFAATANEVCLVLSRETLQPVSFRFGVERAEYTIGATGCAQPDTPEVCAIRWRTSP